MYYNHVYWCESRLCFEDCTLTYKGLHLQIVTWMEGCLIGTHTTSSNIYLYFLPDQILPSSKQAVRYTLHCKK